MNQRHGSAADIARHWSTCSDWFLDAAEHLPPASDEVALPRIQLTATAVEYQLKAFICAVRGGTPGTRDLSRLATLAAHCGLRLTHEQYGGIAALDQTQPHIPDFADVPGLLWVRELCSSISAQTGGAPE